MAVRPCSRHTGSRVSRVVPRPALPHPQNTHSDGRGTGRTVAAALELCAAPDPPRERDVGPWRRGGGRVGAPRGLGRGPRAEVPGGGPVHCGITEISDEVRPGRTPRGLVRRTPVGGEGPTNPPPPNIRNSFLRTKRQ